MKRIVATAAYGSSPFGPWLLPPQYSAQKTSSWPVCVAWNQTDVNMPGTTSRLTRSAGTKNECSTSFDDMTSLTGLCTGTCSSSLLPPFGYTNSQLHCLALTWISIELAGATAMSMYPTNPLWKRNARMKSGATVHAISSGMLWPVGVALWPGRSRYLIAQ